MSAIHPSRIQNVPANSSSASFSKKTFKKNHASKAPPPASSTLTRAQLRKKIRDTTRLLSKESSSNVTAGSRADHERALAAYKHELDHALLNDRMKQMEKKYHMVRFFERRKATRRIHTLTRQIQLAKTSPSPTAPSELSIEQLQSALHNAKVDLAYIFHFPPTEKYISLYKSAKSSTTTTATTPPESTTSKSLRKTEEKQQKIWKDIERRMLDGSLGKAKVDRVDNDRYDNGGEDEEMEESEDERNKNRKSNRDKKKNKDAKQKVNDNHVEEENQDDGGFFEF